MHFLVSFSLTILWKENCTQNMAFFPRIKIQFRVISNCNTKTLNKKHKQHVYSILKSYMNNVLIWFKSSILLHKISLRRLHNSVKFFASYKILDSYKHVGVYSSCLNINFYFLFQPERVENGVEKKKKEIENMLTDCFFIPECNCAIHVLECLNCNLNDQTLIGNTRGNRYFFCLFFISKMHALLDTLNSY